MKNISIRAQRIIDLIPLVNACILFLWLYNYSHTERSKTVFAKSLLLLFLVGVLLSGVQIALTRILAPFSTATQIFNLLILYIDPLIIGYALIEYQRKTLKE